VAAKRSQRTILGQQGWFAAGRMLLIREGIAAVEIGRLVRLLRAGNRGGFYWLFSSRQQLFN